MKWILKKSVLINILSAGIEVLNLLNGQFIPAGTVTFITNGINIVIHAIKASDESKE